MYVTGFLVNVVVAEPFVQPLNHTAVFLKDTEIVFTRFAWTIVYKTCEPDGFTEHFEKCNVKIARRL